MIAAGLVGAVVSAAGAILGVDDVKPDGGSPTIVPIVLVGVLIVAVGIWMIVAVFLQRGPEPEEAALAYEWAWDRLDFPILWELSAPSLRDGRSQADFVADKAAAYGDHRADYVGLIEQVVVESIDAGRLQAVVRTRLVLGPRDTRDDAVEELTNELYLKRDGGTWRVAAYRLDRRAPVRIA